LLTILAGIVLLLIILPPGWTSWLGALGQIALPLQDASSAATHAATDLIGIDAKAGYSKDHLGPARPEYEALLKREQMLENQVAALTSRVSTLERENQVLRAIRDRRGVGAQGRLIRARVVAHDIAPWRSTRIVSAGSTRGVRPGDAVVSREFAIAVGTGDGVSDGLAVLIGEVYLGFVEQTNAFSSRVRLVSDLETQMKVHIGRFNEQDFVLLDTDFWLVGSGNGRMEIKDVARSEIESGRIAVGDAVLTACDQTWLPPALTVGTVEAVEPDRRNPLLAVLTVRSAVSLDTVRTVYVFDPHPDRPE